jgi:hypothetical protein
VKVWPRNVIATEIIIIRSAFASPFVLVSFRAGDVQIRQLGLPFNTKLALSDFRILFENAPASRNVSACIENKANFVSLNARVTIYHTYYQVLGALNSVL